jgi:hypothetical protein
MQKITLQRKVFSCYGNYKQRIYNTQKAKRTLQQRKFLVIFGTTIAKVAIKRKVCVDGQCQVSS